MNMLADFRMPDSRYAVALDELRAKLGTEELSPHDIVNEARDVSSPLHPWFTWDDHEAAEKRRLDEARALVRYCVASFTSGDGSVHSIRAYQHIVETDRSFYERTDLAIADPAHRQQLVDRYLRELKGLQHRFAMLKEFSGVYDFALKRAKKKA